MMVVKSINYNKISINHGHFHIIINLTIISIFKYFKLLKYYFIYFNLFIVRFKYILIISLIFISY
jgi:hypothetical protein